MRRSFFVSYPGRLSFLACPGLLSHRPYRTSVGLAPLAFLPNGPAPAAPRHWCDMASAALPGAIILPPLPGLLPSPRFGEVNRRQMNHERRRGFGPRLANHRLQARPGFAWLFALGPRPGPPEPNRWAKPGTIYATYHRVVWCVPIDEVQYKLAPTWNNHSSAARGSYLKEEEKARFVALSADTKNS